MDLKDLMDAVGTLLTTDNLIRVFGQLLVLILSLIHI